MSHESVWYSRPRTYGKGARSWCVCYFSLLFQFIQHTEERKGINRAGIYGIVRCAMSISQAQCSPFSTQRVQPTTISELRGSYHAMDLRR